MKKVAILLIGIVSAIMIASTCLGALQPPQPEYTTEQYVGALPNFNDIDTSDMVVAPDNFDNWTDQTWYLTPSAQNSSSISSIISSAPIGISSNDEYWYLVYGWKNHPEYDWDDNEYMLIAVWNVSNGEPTGAILLEFGSGGYHDGIIVTIADASLQDLPLKEKFSLSSFSGIALVGSIIALVALGAIVYKANKSGKLDKI